MYRSQRGARPPDDVAGSPSAPVIVPPADAVAIVRHTDPPLSAPELLVAYVSRLEGTRPDWLLTDDAVAFGNASIVDAFAEWRSTWERVWNLDPGPSVDRLLRLLTELDADDGGTLGPLFDDDSEDIVIPHAAQPILRAALARASELIRERDADGYGIVDRTPGVERIGLARAWSSHGAQEIVAADEHTTVQFQPDIGLVVATGSGADRVAVAGVEEVRLRDDAYEIAGRGHTITIDATRARPIAWLMPGSTEWRVRLVPEILAWARTFAGLDEASHYASALQLPLVLTGHRPRLPLTPRPIAD